MGRSQAVMAESLAGYVDVVKDVLLQLRKQLPITYKSQHTYAETFAAFETPMMEDVPTDVAENWIDQLTIKQFNEELADVFPYIYKLVSEATRAAELGPEDLLGRRADLKLKQSQKSRYTISTGKTRQACKTVKIPEEIALEQGFEEMMGQFAEAK